MGLQRLLLKVGLRFFRLPVWIVSPVHCTKLTCWLLAKLGVSIAGRPNYLSAKIWFDGGDYSLISIGHGSTISSNVRILTHDWSPYTAAKAFRGDGVSIKGPSGAVTIGEYAFVGTGAIILPGTTIGRGSIVGAGAVVKGLIPDGVIIIGNPGRAVGNTVDLVEKIYGPV